MATEQTVEELPTIEPSSETSSEQVDAQEEREEPDPRIEHDWDCIAECLLSASNGSLFDEKRFLEIANSLLDRVANKNDHMKTRFHEIACRVSFTETACNTALIHKVANECCCAFFHGCTCVDIP